jgi:putative addiction module antidote
VNKTVKIIKVGNSAAVILPKRDLDRLQAGIGDMLTKVETENGFELKPCDADFDAHAHAHAQMAMARAVMAQRKRALRELAK